MAQDWEAVRSRLAQCGQEHLLRHLGELSEEQKAELYADIAETDLCRVVRCFQESQQKDSDSCEVKDDLLRPLDDWICGSTARDVDSVPRWEGIGLEMISRNEVAVLLLAGGQGTRLGVKYPKGMYNVGLPSGKTLYQLQAERIRRLQKLAEERFGKECRIPWYIMTSDYTKDPTLKFFEKNSYFGLDPRHVMVFEQHMLPCLTNDAKIVLDQKYRLARAPDGNGGLYEALIDPKQNVLGEMETRGVKCVHVYCVDNILVKMADPVFVGFCAEKNAECGAKVVRKTVPTERVGVLCICDGKYQVVEYSEISVATASKRNPDGNLTFCSANICNHFFTIEFLRQVCRHHTDEMSYHIAKKKIPFIDENGERIEPAKPNGIKMEKFVFDVFKFAKNFAVLEVLREDEFSPLKNAPGADKDTPATCRAALLDLNYRQLLAAGGRIMDTEGRKLPLIPHRSSTSSLTDEEGVNGSGVVLCEISPLVSYFGEGLEKLCSGKKFTAPVLL